jgi:hypothetical protein
MGRRQSAPRCQNTLEHGILNDGSPPSSINIPDHSTLLSCLYQHLARLKLAHHGVTTRANPSRPISSAEHYDPCPSLLLCFLPFLSSFPSVFFPWIVIILRGVSEKGRMLFSRHSRISSEGILHLDIPQSLHGAFIVFSVFLIDASREVYAIVSVVFSVSSWVAESKGHTNTLKKRSVT